MKKYLSPTAIERFFNCPMQTYYAENSAKGPRATILVDGSDDHELIERFWKRDLTPGSDEMTQAWDMISGLMSRGLTIWTDVPMIQEEPEGLKIDVNGETFFLIGVPDFAQVKGDTCHIIDWKTGKYVMSSDDAKASMQPQVYAWMYFQMHPHIEHVHFDFAFTQGNIIRSVRKSRYQLEHIERRLKSRLGIMAEAYKSGVFKASPGMSCNFCPMIKSCVDNVYWQQENRKIDVIADDAAFEEIYKQHIVTKKYLEKMDDMLKAYAKQHGVGQICNVQVKLSLIEKYTVSKKKATIAYLQEFCPQAIDAAAVKTKSKFQEFLTQEQKQALIEGGHMTDSSYQKVGLRYDKHGEEV